MIRPILIAVAALFLLAPNAVADIGPKPTTSGATPTPVGEDMAGIEVEMAEEKVNLLIRRDGEKDRLEVEATFLMKNHGDATTFETGFPIGKFKSFHSFSIEIDGTRQAFDVVSRKEGRVRMYWYVWQATYPARAVSRHVVKYAVKVGRHSASPSYAGYVLHTGGPWKGPIGKAVVTLRCGDGIQSSQIDRFEPHTGGERKADHVVWTFTNLEPTTEHDIRFYYSEQTLEGQLAEARLAAKTKWSARGTVVVHLGRRPGYELRDRMSSSEFEEYLDAVAALVEGLREEGDQLILPRKDSDTRDRSYAVNPHNILHWIDFVTKIVKKYPESDRAKALLRTFLRIGETFLAGNLYAEDLKLELVWRGRVDSVEQRARRDASVKKRRAQIADWIENGNRALSSK